MQIEIEYPIFKCADDEAIFFSRLAEVPGYEQVVGKTVGNTVGKNRQLYLTVKDGVEPEVTQELQSICDCWHTTFRIVKK